MKSSNDNFSELQEIITESLHSDMSSYERKYNTIFEFCFPVLYKINLHKYLSKFQALFLIFYFYLLLYFDLLSSIIKYSHYSSESNTTNSTTNQSISTTSSSNTINSRFLYSDRKINDYLNYSYNAFKELEESLYNTDNEYNSNGNEEMNIYSYINETIKNELEYENINYTHIRNLATTNTTQELTTYEELKSRFKNYNSVDRNILSFTELIYLKFFYLTNYHLKSIILVIFIVSVFYIVLFASMFIDWVQGIVVSILSFFNYFMLFIFFQLFNECIKHILYCQKLYDVDPEYTIINPNIDSSRCNIKSTNYMLILGFGIFSFVLIYLICFQISMIFLGNNKYNKLDKYNRLNTFYELFLVNFITMKYIIKFFLLFNEDTVKYVYFPFNMIFSAYLVYFFETKVYFFDFTIHMLNKIGIMSISYNTFFCFILFYADINNKALIILLGNLFLIPTIVFLAYKKRSQIVLNFNLETNTSVKNLEIYLEELLYIYTHPEKDNNKILFQGIFTYYCEQRSYYGFQKLGSSIYYLPLTNEYFSPYQNGKKTATIDMIMVLNLFFDFYNYSFNTLGSQFNLVISWSNFLNYAFGNAFKTIFITQTALRSAKSLDEKASTYFVIENFNRKIFIKNQPQVANKLNLSVIFLYERFSKRLINTVSSLCNNQIQLWKKLISYENPEVFESAINSSDIYDGFFNLAREIYFNINDLENNQNKLQILNSQRKGNSMFFVYKCIKQYLLEDEEYKNRNFIEPKYNKTLEKYFRLFEDQSCAFIVDISENLGKIISFSKNACQIYKYSSQAFKDKNISSIIPKTIAVKHDSFLRTFQLTGKQNILEVPDRNLYTCDSENNLLSSSVTVNFLPLLDFNKIFCIGNIIIKQSEEEFFLAAHEGIVDLATIKNLSLKIKSPLLLKANIYIQFLIPELINYSKINNKGKITLTFFNNLTITSPIYIPYLLHENWQMSKDKNIQIKKLTEFCFKAHSILKCYLQLKDDNENKIKYKKLFYKFVIENSFYYKTLQKDTTSSFNVKKTNPDAANNYLPKKGESSNNLNQFNFNLKNYQSYDREADSQNFDKLVKLYNIEIENMKFEKAKLYKLSFKTKVSEDNDYSVDEELIEFLSKLEKIKMGFNNSTSNNIFNTEGKQKMFFIKEKNTSIKLTSEDLLNNNSNKINESLSNEEDEIDSQSNEQSRLGNRFEKENNFEGNSINSRRSKDSNSESFHNHSSYVDNSINEKDDMNKKVNNTNTNKLVFKNNNISNSGTANLSINYYEKPDKNKKRSNSVLNNFTPALKKKSKKKEVDINKNPIYHEEENENDSNADVLNIADDKDNYDIMDIFKRKDSEHKLSNNSLKMNFDNPIVKEENVITENNENEFPEDNIMKEFHESALLLETKTINEEKSKNQTVNKIGVLFQLDEKETESTSHFSGKSNNSHIKKIQTIRKGIFTNKKPKIISTISSIFISFIFMILALLIFYYVLLYNRTDSYYSLILSSLKYNITISELLYSHYNTRNLFLLDHEFYSLDRNSYIYDYAYSSYEQYSFVKLKGLSTQINNNLQILENNHIKNLKTLAMNTKINMQISKEGVYTNFYYNEMSISDSIFIMLSRFSNLFKHDYEIKKTYSNDFSEYLINYYNYTKYYSNKELSKDELISIYRGKTVNDYSLDYNIILTNSINKILNDMKNNGDNIINYIFDYRNTDNIINISLFIVILVILLIILILMKCFHNSSSGVETSIIKILLSYTNIPSIKNKLNKTILIHKDLFTLTKFNLNYSTDDFEFENDAVDDENLEIKEIINKDNKNKLSEKKRKQKNSKNISEIKKTRDKLINSSLDKNSNRITSYLYIFQILFFCIILGYLLFVYLYNKNLYYSTYDLLNINSSVLEVFFENVISLLIVKESILGLVYKELIERRQQGIIELDKYNITNNINNSLNKEYSAFTFNTYINSFYYQKIRELDLETYITNSYNQQYYQQEKLNSFIQNYSEKISNLKVIWNLIFNSDACATFKEYGIYSPNDIIESYVNASTLTNGEADYVEKTYSKCKNLNGGVLTNGLLQSIELYNNNINSLLELINSVKKEYEGSVASNGFKINKSTEYINELTSFFNFNSFITNEQLIEEYLTIGYNLFYLLSMESMESSYVSKQNLSKAVTVVAFIFLFASFLFCYTKYFSSMKLRFKQVLTLLCILPSKCVKDVKLIPQLNSLELE